MVEREYWDPVVWVEADREVEPRYLPRPEEPAARRDMRHRECARPRPGRR